MVFAKQSWPQGEDAEPGPAEPNAGVTGIRLSGATRLFPVIGDPVEQVKSPDTLTRILSRRGANAIVPPFQVARDDFDHVMEALRKIANVGGMLITIPHKSAALRHCARISERARLSGAVNVMRRQGYSWIGDNTDGQGYVDGIETEEFEVSGKRVLLIGCGGAGSAIALEVLNRGAAELAIHDIDLEKRDRTIGNLADRFGAAVKAGSADPAGFDLIAHASPMGMHPGDPLPVDVSRLEARQFVACAITKPEVSPLIGEARRLGCRTMTGAGMFCAQAETLADFLLAGDPAAGLKDHSHTRMNLSPE